MNVLSVLLTSGPNDLHWIRADDVIRFVARIQFTTEQNDGLSVTFKSQSRRQILSPTIETVQLWC